MRPRISIRGCFRRSVGPSVRWSVGWMVGWSVTRFFSMPKMNGFLYKNHWDGPTLTLLSVLGVLNVLNLLNVLNVLYVLNGLNVLTVPNVPKDACLALFSYYQGRACTFRCIQNIFQTKNQKRFFPSTWECSLSMISLTSFLSKLYIYLFYIAQPRQHR